MVLHFDALKLICHLLDHCSILSMSFCRASVSRLLLMALYRFALSANLIIWLSIFSSISLIYMRNRSGPNAEPSGTQLVTGCQFEEVPLKTTRCFLELNQSFTQSTVLESIPTDCIFISSLS